MKKISVIIPSYNSCETIQDCILSIIQTGYSNLEIIVVDDTSTDNSPQLVEDLVKEYPNTLKLLYHEKNGGPSKARNTGASVASGDYLFFVDSDTQMMLETLDNFVKRIAEADAVTGIYHYEPIQKGWVQQYKAFLNYYYFKEAGVKKYSIFAFSCAGIKVDIFNKLGGG